MTRISSSSLSTAPTTWTTARVDDPRLNFRVDRSVDPYEGRHSYSIRKNGTLTATPDQKGQITFQGHGENFPRQRPMALSRRSSSLASLRADREPGRDPGFCRSESKQFGSTLYTTFFTTVIFTSCTHLGNSQRGALPQRVTPSSCPTGHRPYGGTSAHPQGFRGQRGVVRFVFPSCRLAQSASSSDVGLGHH